MSARSQNVVVSLPCRHQSFHQESWKSAVDCTKMLINLPKSAIPQWWEKWKSGPESVSTTGSASMSNVKDCQLVADVSARRLRSADTATCVTRRTSNIFGDRCIAAAGPRLWNTLVVHLRQCHSLEQLKHLLKTFLFSAWGHGTLQHLLKVAPYINLLTYLSGLQVKGKCEWSTWGWGGQSEVGFGGFELNRLSVWILS